MADESIADQTKNKIRKWFKLYSLFRVEDKKVEEMVRLDDF